MYVQGLFFRTPRDPTERGTGSRSLPHTQLSYPQPIGLGYGLEHPEPVPGSSEGQSDDSTVEITTPVNVAKAGGSFSPYLGYLDPSLMDSVNVRGGSTARLLASFEPHSPLSLDDHNLAVSPNEDSDSE